MIICLKCKTENRDDATFCSQCGTKLDTSSMEYQAEILKAESRRLAKQSGKNISPLDKLSQSVHSIKLEQHSFTALSVLSVCLLIAGIALLLLGGAGFASSFNPASAPAQFNAPTLSGGGQIQPSSANIFSLFGNIVTSIFSLLLGFVFIVSSEFIKVQITLVENSDKQALLTRALFQIIELNSNRKDQS